MNQTHEQRRVNFVAPYAEDERQAPALPVVAEPIQVTDMAGAWLSPQSPTRDSISAKDRAEAFVIRQTPIYVVTVVVAVAVTVAYTLFAWAAGVNAPWAMDKLLVFLLMLAGGLFVTHSRANRTDYEHTHAGTERLRIMTAAEIRKAELQAELEIRRTALETSVRLLEGRK